MNLRIKFGALAILILIGGMGCNKEYVFSTLHGEAPWVLGHGGNGFGTVRNPFPLNSMPAIRQSLEIEGARGVELDVRMTADGVLVLCHAQELENETNCSGCVEQKAAEEVLQCKLKSNPLYQVGEDFSIITLDSVMGYFADFMTKPFLYINAKPTANCEGLDISAHSAEMASRIWALIQQHQGLDWVWVESDYEPFLRSFHDLAPQVRTFSGVNNVQAAKEMAERIGLDGIVVDNNQITDLQVQELHQQGHWVGIFGVKIKSGAKKAIAKSPDFILVDDVRMTRQLLGN